MSDSFAIEFYDRYWAYRYDRGDTVASNRMKLRHQQARAFIRKCFPVAEGVRVLDLGCGDGVMGQLLSPAGYAVTGVDVSHRALALAEPYYAGTQSFDLDSDATPEAWRGAFDAVVCMEVLEHIETPERNIARCFDACKPGGVAAFSFPNLFSLQNRLTFLRGRWPKGYCTYDPREHLQVFELKQFKRWVQQAGFKQLSVAVTPQLPRSGPMRRLMFASRHVFNHVTPSLWAMQLSVFAHKPGG